MAKNICMGIYCIRNTINGKRFIGQTWKTQGFVKRFAKHKYLLRRGGHHNTHLQHSWDKYGEKVFVFEILEVCDQKTTKTKLTSREQYWANFYDSFNSQKGYNKGYIVESRAGYIQGPHSEDTKRRLREAAPRGENSPHWGKHPTEETRKKMSEAAKNRFVSVETRNKISSSNVGKHYKWGSHTDATKMRISAALTGEKAPASKLTWQMVRKIREKYLTDNYSYAELAKEYGVTKPTIGYIIRNITWREDNNE